MQAVVQGCSFTNGFKWICRWLTAKRGNPILLPALPLPQDWTPPPMPAVALESCTLTLSGSKSDFKKDLLFVCLPVNLSWISWSVPDPVHHSITKKVVKTCSNVKREKRVAHTSVNSSSAIKTQSKLHRGLNVSQLHELSIKDNIYSSAKYVHYINHGESFILDTRCTGSK